MNVLRIGVVGVALAGALAIAAPAIAAPSTPARVGAKMYEEVGPFASYEGCTISRELNDRPTNECIFQWDRSHPFGWYFGFDD